MESRVNFYPKKPKMLKKRPLIMECIQKQLKRFKTAFIYGVPFKLLSKKATND